VGAAVIGTAGRVGQSVARSAVGQAAAAGGRALASGASAAAKAPGLRQALGAARSVAQATSRGLQAIEGASQSVGERVAQGLLPRASSAAASAESAATAAAEVVTPQTGVSAARFKALRSAITDANKKIVSEAEREGIRYTIARVEAQGYELRGGIKYGGNQGIDLEFVGVGQNQGRLALAEAKASPGLGSLKKDVLGIRQGSREFFQTRADRAGRIDVVDAIDQGVVDFFGGFARSDRLFRFNFQKSANFRTDVGAATLVL